MISMTATDASNRGHPSNVPRSASGEVLDVGPVIGWPISERGARRTTERPIFR
jgi:hypothetical protein